jgi:hypothetical protein
VIRPVEARISDVRRLLDAAREVHAGRAALRDRIAETTGLTPAGVELGFESLEQEASDADLRALVDAAGQADHVHVVLSANVFIAPLRAIALARAASPRVTVRPSLRDPVLARALVHAAADPAVTLVEDRDVARVVAGPPGLARRVDVYGRAATIAGVRASVAEGVEVRGHGPGMGVAVVAGDVAAAAGRVAVDVAAFDQRGCLSPRVVLVVGDPSRAEELALELHAALAALGRRVPRGSLDAEESAGASRWRDAVAFAGRLFAGEDHAVGLLASLDPSMLPPAGRHVLVVPLAPEGGVESALAPVAPYVVAVGSDDPAVAGPPHARRSALGAMQRPPLDGPVDRRRE